MRVVPDQVRGAGRAPAGARRKPPPPPRRTARRCSSVGLCPRAALICTAGIGRVATACFNPFPGGKAVRSPPPSLASAERAPAVPVSRSRPCCRRLPLGRPVVSRAGVFAGSRRRRLGRLTGPPSGPTVSNEKPKTSPIPEREHHVRTGRGRGRGRGSRCSSDPAQRVGLRKPVFGSVLVRHHDPPRPPISVRGRTRSGGRLAESRWATPTFVQPPRSLLESAIVRAGRRDDPVDRPSSRRGGAVCPTCVAIPDQGSHAVFQPRARCHRFLVSIQYMRSHLRRRVTPPPKSATQPRLQRVARGRAGPRVEAARSAARPRTPRARGRRSGAKTCSTTPISPSLWKGTSRMLRRHEVDRDASSRPDSARRSPTAPAVARRPASRKNAEGKIGPAAAPLGSRRSFHGHLPRPDQARAAKVGELALRPGRGVAVIKFRKTQKPLLLEGREAPQSSFVVRDEPRMAARRSRSRSRRGRPPGAPRREACSIRRKDESETAGPPPRLRAGQTRIAW